MTRHLQRIANGWANPDKRRFRGCGFEAVEKREGQARVLGGVLDPRGVCRIARFEEKQTHTPATQMFGVACGARYRILAEARVARQAARRRQCPRGSHSGTPAAQDRCQ